MQIFYRPDMYRASSRYATGVQIRLKIQTYLFRKFTDIHNGIFIISM